MPPRLKLIDIARLAGVSRATASYVINGQARARRISDETVDKVMAVVRQSGFRIDAQAAALRRGESRTIGLLIPDLENTSYARLAKLLERGSRRHGYQLLIADSDDDIATERELALGLRARGCDALIVASALPMGDAFYVELKDDGLPVIALDRALDPGRFACVVSDDRVSAETLTRSLLAPGLASVAWLDAMPEIDTTIERREGFHRAVAGRGMRVREYNGERYDRKTGAALCRRMLEEGGLPDVLVTASYTLLSGVLDALLALPAGLPPELRVGTFGNDRLLDFLPLKVNAMVQRHAEIAERALARALGAIQGDYRPGRDAVPRELLRRL
ncbi:catabolite repressor/activator [Frateuria defendens]|uniref:catabolite repressor/activator n=1 Tax=Frateuria defendens TaxID=2219559 RepID=UPI000B1700F1|nr:catabolite repressor/activator [Frateuria defendens]